MSKTLREKAIVPKVIPADMREVRYFSYLDVKQAVFEFEYQIKILNAKYEVGLPFLELYDKFKEIFGEFDPLRDNLCEKEHHQNEEEFLNNLYGKKWKTGEIYGGCLEVLEDLGRVKKIKKRERLEVYKELTAKTAYLEDNTALSNMIKSKYEKLKKEVEEDTSKKCLNCGREVEYLNVTKLYCSKKCGDEYRSKKLQ